MQDILYQFATVVITALGGYVATKAIAYLESKTKDTRLITALEFAKQAVVMVDTTEGATGAEKQQLAMTQLYQRLADNGYAKHFSQDQMTQLLERAFTAIKKAGK